MSFETSTPPQRVKVAIGADAPDGYGADNDRFAVAPSSDRPRVLVIAGAAGGPSSGFYLSRALLAGGEEEPDFEVSVVGGQAFAAMSPAQVRAHAVLALLSTHGLDRRAGETIRGFIDDGGGVFVAAAPDMDPAVLSTLLDLQPALDPRDARNAGVLAVTDLRHPVFRPFEALAANFGQVSFERVWAIDPGRAWRVAARYTGGAPALLERATPASTGSRSAPGHVLLFTSDVDHRWNDFPLHASFVPFAQEVARYLGAGPRAVAAALVADVPAGVAATPGIADVDGRAFAINVDPRESDVSALSASAFEEAITRTAPQDRPRAARLGSQTEARQNYWRYGLVLMLATLVAEAFVGSRS